MWEPSIMLLFGLGYVLVMYMLTNYTYSLLYRQRVVTRNYLGFEVVQSFGLIICIHYLFFLLLLFWFNQIINPSQLFVDNQMLIEGLPLFLIGLGTISFIGWIDDLFGTQEVKGIRGHILAFFVERKLTTGFLKAVIGSLVALFSMYMYSETILLWLLNSGLIIFSIHVFNLLDVRPGRAIKSYWFLSVLLIPFYPFDVLLVHVFPAIISTVLIFPFERKCLTMLGDAGSNVLGFIFGYSLVKLNDMLLQVIIFSCFVLLSILAEKISLSEYIQKYPWLAKVDNWGINRFSTKED